MPKYCDGNLTGKEAPTSGGSMKDMMGTTAKETPSHISGTNSTSQYTTPTPEKGKLGNRGKQA